MSNDEILRMYACAALSGLLAGKLPINIDNNLISKQAWIIAYEMRLEEIQNDKG